jgi:hypothetical protein
MKTKTIKLLFATLLVGLFVSCEPAKSYYPWESESSIEKPAPVTEQVVPQQFSTNAKLLEPKAGENGYLFLLYYPGNDKASGVWKTEKYVIFALWFTGDNSYQHDSQTYTHYTKAKDTFDKGRVKPKN